MFQQADWIGSDIDLGEVCPEFLREIIVGGEVERALLYITSIGVYEAQLDGERIGNFVMAPGCTVYRERLQYQEYDVTGLLRDKSHSYLTVTVGSGWHRGRISAGSPDIHDMPAALIAQLEISYVDGRRETIVTDENWKVRRSRFLQADIYDGETYDAFAPEEPESPVKVLKELSKERLIPQEGEIICEHERIKPLRYLKTPAGEWVIDFGQNLADNFNAMKRWVDYMTSDSKDKYLWICGTDEKKLWGKHYGDWLAQDAPYGSYIGATDIDFISSAFYSYSVALLVMAGKALGMDMTEYEERHRKIVTTIRKTFPERKTQTAYVLALKFGLTEDPAKEAAELVQMIRDNGNRLQTGFLGALGRHPGRQHHLEQRHGFIQPLCLRLCDGLDLRCGGRYSAGGGASRICKGADRTLAG